MTNTKTSTEPKPIHLIITPHHTTIDGEIIYPDSIWVALENGHGYDINEIIDMLEVHDKKKHKATKPKAFRRLRHVKQAVTTAVREALNDDLPNAPKS